MSPGYRQYLPYFSLICATFLWASSFIALKIAFQAYDPMVVIFGRLLVAAMFIPIILKPFRNLQYRKGDWKRLAFMGLCEPCFYFLFEAKALEYTSASQAGMITGTLPLFVAVVAWIALKEKIGLYSISGFVLAIIGIVLLSVGSEVTENAPNPLLGNFMEVMAMVMATGYIITLKGLSKHYSSLFLTTFQAFIGAIFFLPLLLLPSTQLPTAFSPLPAFAILYLGIFVTFAAYGAYNFGVSKIPASQATAFINLIPVFTLIMGVLILGDQLTPMQYIAVGLVLGGIWLSQKRSSIKSAVELPS